MEPRTDLLPSSPSQNWLQGKFELETPRSKVKTAVLTAQFPQKPTQWSWDLYRFVGYNSRFFWFSSPHFCWLHQPTAMALVLCHLGSEVPSDTTRCRNKWPLGRMPPVLVNDSMVSWNSGTPKSILPKLDNDLVLKQMVIYIYIECELNH